MPLWLVFMALGVVALCAAYYLPLPPPFKSVCMFFGIVLLVLGSAMLLVVILRLAGVTVPG